MKRKNENKIYWRSFVTFLVILTFLVISISGIVLYFAPPGRVAYWSIWKFMALTKTQWQALHTIFTFLFIAGAAVHIYFNWKVIVSYLKVKINEGMKRGKELVLSSSAAVIILVFTLTGAPPFSYVMDLGEDLSNSWATHETEPPIPHAELLTIPEFAEVVKIPAGKIISTLKNNGINVEDSLLTIKQVAEKNNLSPQQLYGIFQKNGGGFKTTFYEGSGLGRKSINEISEQMGMPVTFALNKLKTKGIEADAESSIRDIASRNKKLPIEIVKMLQEN